MRSISLLSCALSILSLPLFGANPGPVPLDPSSPAANLLETRTPLSHSAVDPVTNIVGPPSESLKALTNAPPIDPKLETLNQARSFRRDRLHALADETLTGLLQDPDLPPDLAKQTLLELAAVAQELNQFTRAQKLYAQILSRFPSDPSIPEILLRQGLLYRQMGLSNLALSKFYAVMTSALTLKAEQMDFYKRLVLLAQTEIANTYYAEAKFAEASEFLTRLLRLETDAINKPQIHFKLIRSLSSLDRRSETVAQAQLFLEAYPQSSDGPEVRFLLAQALKDLGQKNAAIQQVLALLESQQSSAETDLENWRYWQQRAGNTLANQLYKEGDYLNALELYMRLLTLHSSPQWQIPVLYQIGLACERLQQHEKALQAYREIEQAQAKQNPTNAPPSLQAIVEMAQWRTRSIQWLDRADQNMRFVYSPSGTNAPSPHP